MDHASSYVFLSYASADRERALHVADRLEASGVSVWIDRKSIAGGTSWSAEIVRGIRGCTSLLVLCSPAAVGSGNVQQEIQLAWETKRPILPLLLEQVDLPDAVRYALAGRQWVEVLGYPDVQWLPVALRALRGHGVEPRQPPPSEHGSPVPDGRPLDLAPTSPDDPLPRHNLPVQVTSFVGRERELAAVRELLATSRLLTLTGPGGCGKTRLALRVAVNLVEAFPDGVWLVELAPVANPDIVPQTVAVALGVRETPGVSPLATLTGYLRRRELLLLLDNCEHLIDASAQLANTLMRACPNVRLLATSRELFGVAGETPWRVPPLTVPDPQLIATGSDVVAVVTQSEAVRLFVERATVVAPRFAVTEQNARALAQICQRLDGIPLAIELAAARIAVLSVEQIAARLDQRFRLLTGGSRTALRRQQTLQATIDWSYDLLSEEERTVLQRLSVFVGGCTLDAVEAVCSDTGVGERVSIPRDDVLDLLTRLVAKSLVLAEEKSEDTRYRLLETIRQYAGEKLVGAGEAEAVRTRHRDWYLDLTEQALPALEWPDQKRWADRLEDEHDNLRAALAWSAANPADAPALLRLAAALGRFWSNSGYSREGIEWLDLAVARSAATPSVDRARALTWLGHFEMLEGNVERSQPLLEESVAQGRMVGDRHVLAQSLRYLSYTTTTLGDQARARRLIEEALAVSREAGYKREIAFALHTLAWGLVKEDAQAVIEPLLVESLSIARESGDAIAVCEALFGLTWVYQRRGEFARARNTLDDCLALARRVDLRWPIQLAHLYRGDLAAIEQDLREAIEWYRQALRMMIDLHRGMAAYALGRYAAVCAALGDHHRAVRLFGAASTAPRIEDFFFLFAGSVRPEEDLAAARLALGDNAFAAAWAEGQAMIFEQAVDYALEAQEN